MKTLKEALDALEAQPDIEMYLAEQRMLNLAEGRLRAHGCPVAQYLHAETGDHTIWVDPFTCGSDSSITPQRIKLSRRVSAFVDAFDAEP